MGRWCFLIGFKLLIPLIASNKLVDRLRHAHLFPSRML